MEKIDASNTELEAKIIKQSVVCLFSAFVIMSSNRSELNDEGNKRSEIHYLVRM